MFSCENVSRRTYRHPQNSQLEQLPEIMREEEARAGIAGQGGVRRPSGRPSPKPPKGRPTGGRRRAVARQACSARCAGTSSLSRPKDGPRDGNAAMRSPFRRSSLNYFWVLLWSTGFSNGGAAPKGCARCQTDGKMACKNRVLLV